MSRQSLAMLRGGLPGARWIDPENYHLTLRFIGDIDDALAHEIAVHARPRAAHGVRAAARRPVVVRRPQAARAWSPRWRRSQPLMELQAEHERLMQRVGLEPEGRKYTPHVTLARLRDSSSRQVAEYLGARGHFRSAPFQVSRFVLFSSRASVGGGPYVVEAAYPLGEPALRRASRVSPQQRATATIEHRGGEAVAVGHELAHQRQRRRLRRRDLADHAAEIEATARRRTCAPAAACAGCRRGTPCAGA